MITSTLLIINILAVRLHLKVTLEPVQVEDMESGWCCFSPTFQTILEMLNSIIDNMVGSTTRIRQVQHELFQAADDVPETYLTGVIADEYNVPEEILDSSRERISKVLEQNTLGPIK